MSPFYISPKNMYEMCFESIKAQLLFQERFCNIKKFRFFLIVFLSMKSHNTSKIYLPTLSVTALGIPSMGQGCPFQTDCVLPPATQFHPQSWAVAMHHMQAVICVQFFYTRECAPCKQAGALMLCSEWAAQNTFKTEPSTD